MPVYLEQRDTGMHNEERKAKPVNIYNLKSLMSEVTIAI